jgi:hypothetical protein
MDRSPIALLLVVVRSMKTRTALLLPVFVLLSAQTPWEWNYQETQDYFRGMQEIQMNGWGATNARVHTVIRKLIVDTGKTFHVVPGQQFTIGQAHNGGWIILDISTTQKGDDVLAFWLAHEWAHEHLGHAANIYQPVGDPWRYRPLPSSDEDAADVWAGGFAARHGYALAPILADLRRQPADPSGAHSPGAVRAENVKAAYEAETGTGGGALITEQCFDVPVPCTHQAHPEGHLVPCSCGVQHPYDMIQCQHTCQYWNGYGPCHSYDEVPCMHPVHPLGDFFECTHALHFAGDMQRECR